MAANLQTATVGGGCFWCLEAVYSNIKGVHSAISGYAGGQTQNPTYKDVCTGKTGHAEVVQIKFDSDVISYEKILEIFWQIHDPTTLNRQGNDIGTQYRSVIYYENDAQKVSAIKSKDEAQKKFSAKIVTQIESLPKFYKAEDYHQNYFKNNPEQGYCQFIIAPKVQKFEKVNSQFLK
ncbi:MAG: msrA peptide-methionine (S)-S-oxide reductase [Pseudomonadota bacterium]